MAAGLLRVAVPRRLTLEWEWFGNRNLSTKIFIALAALLLVNAGIGLVSIPWQSPVIVQAEEHDRIPQLVALNDLQLSVNAHRRAQFEYLVARTEPERKQAEKHLRVASESAAAAQQAYISLVLDSGQASVRDEVNDGLASYFTISRQVMDLVEPNEARKSVQHKRHRRVAAQSGRKKKIRSEHLAADLLFGPEETALAKIDSSLQSAVALAITRSSEPKQARTPVDAFPVRRIEWGMLISLGFGLPFALVISFLIARPIRKNVAVARKISAGDLSEVFMEVERGDEAGELARCLDGMASRLRWVLQSAANCAQRVAAEGETISLATSRQTETVDLLDKYTKQVTATVQRMAEAGHEIYDESGRSAESACQWVEMIRNGGSAVEGMLRQLQSVFSGVNRASREMREIGKSREAIGRIVSLIEDIARQTSLLASNAGAEAARSGENGRAFAAMTEQAEKLAERVNRATEEIGLLGGQIQNESTSAATSMSDAAAQAEPVIVTAQEIAELLAGVLTGSQKIAEMVTRLSHVSSQQISAADHIAPSMEEITKLARSSVDNAQHSAIAAVELSVVAIELQNLANHLSTSDTQNAEKQKASAVLDWRVNDTAERQRSVAHDASGPVLAAKGAMHPGGARIHARLLSEDDPEFHHRGPSAAS